MAGVRTLAAAAAFCALTGCAHAPNRRTVVVDRPAGSPATSQLPRPVRTIIRSFRTYRAGQVADFHAQAGVALRIRVDHPRASRTRLSSSYGYPPQHGYYLTFRVRIVNTGRKSVPVGPADFVVRAARQGVVTSYDGNSPYSGASRQLDPTEIGPGERVSGPLTFDVRSTHGRFDFRPDGTTVVAWTF